MVFSAVSWDVMGRWEGRGGGGLAFVGLTCRLSRHEMHVTVTALLYQFTKYIVPIPRES